METIVTQQSLLREMKEMFSSFNNELNLMLFLGCFISFYIFLKIGLNRLHYFLSKKKNLKLKNIDQYIILTKGYFLFFISLYVATQIIHISPTIDTIISKLTYLLTLLQFASWFNYFVAHWIEESVKRKSKTNPSIKNALSLFRLSGKICVWGVFGLMFLTGIGFNISALLAGLGIGGIAIGLAAQKILGDLFASISIVLDNPFAVGDKISFGEFVGRVEYIGLKTTHLRSKTGELIVCSNADLIATRIKNFERVTDLKVEILLTIALDTETNTLKSIPQLLKKTIEETPHIVFKDCFFSHYAQGSLAFTLSYIIEHKNLSDEPRIKEDINYKILDLFESNNIKLAYPTHRLFVDLDTKSLLSSAQS